ncbi:hypothetical protein QVD17_34221 [Tagetes erecta]|uniref:Uncharacterized protein n=1 Tax=Tagetes erecta TaxID=13708 RepID=A0AAD8JZ91_TARER|nr:hypothetical protein QVD17_34221 [Tagetes erecta]
MEVEIEMVYVVGELKIDHEKVHGRRGYCELNKIVIVINKGDDVVDDDDVDDEDEGFDGGNCEGTRPDS